MQALSNTSLSKPTNMKYNFDEIIDRRNTDCVKYDRLENFFGQKDLLPFWVADMDFNVPPCISDAITERVNHKVYGYTYRGENCIENIINWQKTRHNWTIEKEWITSSPGVVTALSMILFSLTNEGDGIIIQPPVYHPFFFVIRDTKRKLIENPLKRVGNSYEMDFEDLEEKAKQGAKAIIICNPHNPVGRAWKEEELLKLGKIAKKYNLLIISDEIHQDLVYQPNRHTSIASLSEDLRNRTVTCIAPSKTFNVAGLASSVVLIPNQELKEKYETILSTLHLENGNLFGHIAMEAGYSKGHKWLDELLQYLQGNIQLVDDFLKEHLPKIKLIKTEATYLLWLDCSELEYNCDELNDILINKAQLALNKGTMFGDEGENFMRLNIGCPRSILKLGLEKLKQTIKV